MGFLDGAEMIDGVVTIPLVGQPSGDAVAGDPTAAVVSGDFFAGPENRLVEPAVHGVLTRQPTPYNPLVLYGPSGTGKSHLARAVAAAWKDRFPAGRVVSVNAADFARQWAEALETQAVEDFRARYRTAALLVLEDLAELSGKAAAQTELIATLDALLAEGSQVVVTASAAPGALSHLAPSLQGRLSAGLTIPLAPPGPDTRLAILQRWATLRGADLGDSVLRLLAEGLSGTVPELLGALVQLELPARLDGRPVDARLVREFLAQRDAASQPEMHTIALATARYFSLKLSDLRSASRRRPVVVARDVAIFLCRSLTGESLQRIGEYFGGRDHTTVMHAWRKMEELHQTDAEIRRAVETLRRRFQ
jgi:chromosomal replication initiator protein